jgi:hypothetical protein
MSQSQPIDKKPKVAVSYAWREEERGPNEGKVEELCSDLSKAGLVIVRDTKSVRPGDSLVEFVNKLADEEHLCVFLSESYLRSHWCMRELYAAWNRSQSDPARFGARVKVWVLPGLSLDGDLKVWTTHWKEKAAKKAEERKGIDPTHVIEELNDERIYGKIAGDINSILHYVVKHHHPKDWTEFRNWVEQSLPGAVLTAPSPIQSNPPSVSSTSTVAVVPPVTATPPSKPRPDYRGKVIEALEEKLSLKVMERVAPELATIRHFGTFNKVRFSVAKSLQSGPDDVYEIMMGLERKVKAMLANGHLKPADKRQHLADVVAGVVVLGMSPEWIETQFSELEQGKQIPVPSDGGTVPVGGEHSADLLYLVSRAFFSRNVHIDGALTRLFKEDSLASADTGLGEDLRSIGPDDMEFELKLHLVQELHPRGAKRGKASGKMDASQRTFVSDRFREVIGYVNRDYDKGEPRYLSHEDYARHIPTIRQMGLDKLLFLIPTAGNFDEAFKQHVEVLSVAWDLHRLLVK